MTLFNQNAPAAGFDLTGNPFIDSLYSPEDYFRTKWATVLGGMTQVSYSFPFLNGLASRFTDSYGAEPSAAQHFGVTNAQIAGINLAFQRWADVANIRFTKVAETAAGVVGDIRIAFSSEVSSDFWGYTKIFSDGRDPSHGDIWIEPSIKDGTFQPFTYDFTAMMHEIGHALGLDHPFQGIIMPEGFDDARYTIMSYTSPKGDFFFKPGTSEAQYIIVTPGVYDIAAVQKIYGANMSKNTGNSVYAFTPDQPVYQTIWDAGGNDTLDVSTFALGCTITLVAGRYSALAYPTTTLDANIGIAFNCTIENAIGGAGNDIIGGNAANNRLKGNGGDDVMNGAAGNDKFHGGAGNDIANGGSGDDTFLGGNDAGNDRFSGDIGYDTLSYAGAKAGVTVNLAQGTAAGTAAGDAAGIGQDRIFEIEVVIGSAFADRLNGSTRADVLIGGGGDDRIAGGSGIDTASYANAGAGVKVHLGLSGAQDTLAAGIDTLSGIENLTGSAHADRLTGNAGANLLWGGGGADILSGGGGADFLQGGSGADTFRFARSDFGGLTASTADRIADFSRADADRIDLSAIDARAGSGTANDAFTFIGSQAFGNVAGQLRAVIDGTMTLLSGDTNGDGQADFLLRLDGALTLAAGDLVL